MCVFVPVSRILFIELHVAPIATGKFICESKITRISAGAIVTWFRILPRNGWVSMYTRISWYTGIPTCRTRIPLTNVMIFGPTTIPVLAPESKAGFGGSLALPIGLSRTIHTNAIIVISRLRIITCATPLLKCTLGYFAGVKFSTTLLLDRHDRCNTVGTITTSSSTGTGTVSTGCHQQHDAGDTDTSQHGYGPCVFLFLFHRRPRLLVT